MKKKAENYLEKVPKKSENIKWEADENGIVTLFIENKGIFDRILQKIAKKPKISQVHLDETGSFVWQKIDGERDLIEIGRLQEERFGEKIHPTYERLAEYVRSLENCGFIVFS